MSYLTLHFKRGLMGDEDKNFRTLEPNLVTSLWAVVELVGRHQTTSIMSD